MWESEYKQWAQQNSFGYQVFTIHCGQAFQPRHKLIIRFISAPQLKWWISNWRFTFCTDPPAATEHGTNYFRVWEGHISVLLNRAGGCRYKKSHQLIMWVPFLNPRHLSRRDPAVTDGNTFTENSHGIRNTSTCLRTAWIKIKMWCTYFQPLMSTDPQKYTMWSKWSEERLMKLITRNS